MLDHISTSDTGVVIDKPVKASKYIQTHIITITFTALGFAPSGRSLAISMYFDVAQSCSLSSN